MFAIIKKIIRIAVRLIFGFATGMWWLVIGELIVHSIGGIRYSPDEYFKVITGFDGCGDVGHYEYTDNGFARFIGWIFAIFAFIARVMMVLFLLGGGATAV